MKRYYILMVMAGMLIPSESYTDLAIAKSRKAILKTEHKKVYLVNEKMHARLAGARMLSELVL